MNPYLQFARDFAQLTHKARTFPLGTEEPLLRPGPTGGTPAALFFAPHPDDECICGGIVLRLLQEAGMRAINVAVTLGSNKDRQQPRFRELQRACDYIGFELVAAAPNGLERINVKTREQDPTHWSACVNAIVAVLRRYVPKVVVCPHDRDWNSTHIGTHYLIVDALKQMPPEFRCFLFESEFWGQMTDPNLMLELSSEQVAEMITALTFHVGELARNPYHLTLPAWMMDNVRRGAEIVGGQGGPAPDFSYAVLYRLRQWQRGQLSKIFGGGRQISATINVQTAFA
jgi:N-acetylglucosamine malate deacetylase 1